MLSSPNLGTTIMWKLVCPSKMVTSFAPSAAPFSPPWKSAKIARTSGRERHV